MANNQFVGKMSFVVDAQTSGLAATMAGAGQSVENFGNKAVKTTSKVASQSKRMAKFGNQMQQFGFLVDDAFTGFSARGFPGMIQAAANNATMLAMQMGVVAGLSTVLVMGAAQLYLTLSKQKKALEGINDELKQQVRLSKQLESENASRINLASDSKESRIEHDKFMEGDKTLEEVEGRIEAKQKEARAIRTNTALLENELGAQEERKRLIQVAINDLVKMGAEESKIKEKIEERSKVEDEIFSTRRSLMNLTSRSVATERELSDLEGAKLDRAKFLKLRDQQNEVANQMLDARQAMLDSGRQVKLSGEGNNLEIEITANTDEFDSQLDAAFFKYSRMIREAENIPDEAARGMKLQAILAAADKEMTDLAEKAGQVDVNLGSMRSVGASEAGSTQAFSLINRAINSNRQDQENITSAVNVVAAKVAEANKKIDKLNTIVRVVR